MRADDDIEHTECYDALKLLRSHTYITVLTMLRHGPRRPSEMDQATRTWVLGDRWAQTTRRIRHSQIVDALHALTAIGLVERRELTTGFRRSVEYSLTLAGEECLAALDQLRHWVRRNPTILDNAITHYHQTRGHH